MTTLHSFIISWEGQHQGAATIAESIESQSDHTTIIYSDPDPLLSFLTRAEKVLYRLLIDHIGSQIEEMRKHKRRFKFW
jgi:hypothetical protein